MTDWPPEYDTTTIGRPHWTVQQALWAGRALATAMLGDARFARDYLFTVRAYYADRGEHAAEYFGWIDEALKRSGATFDTTGCNAHDFANTHRAAWLILLETFASLVDKNPHDDWGDPPMVGIPAHRGISRGEDALVADRVNPTFVAFHNIPNLTGSFAISTDDLAAPPIDR